MPSHPTVRRLIELSGCFIAAPSGNRSGRPSPTTASDMFEDMAGRIPLILDGGTCDVGVESTVIDLSGEKPRILRPGGITPEMIAAVCGGCVVDPGVLQPVSENTKVRSPGMKYRHYAPKGKLTIYRGEDERVMTAIARAYDESEAGGSNTYILCLEPHRQSYGTRKTLSRGNNAADAARELFAALREADRLGAERIFSEAVDLNGIGLAVMNRLGRAAAFEMIDV